MQNEFKVPKHLSSKFAKLKPEERVQMISEYKGWFANPFTEALIEDLEKKYEALLKESESKSDFLSLFQSKYYDARNKAERKTLKGIVNQLKYN
jgi:hypothetical protein